jgi:hypothetical protein
MIVYGAFAGVAVVALVIGVILGRLFTRPTRLADLTVSLLPDDQGQQVEVDSFIHIDIEAGSLTYAAELVIALFPEQGEQG